MRLLQELLQASRATYEKAPQAAEALLQTGLETTSFEGEKVELAAWTSVARGLLNMHETITRN